MKSLLSYLLAATIFALTPASAALTGYLKIGDISGESKAADHEEEIDVYSISWGVARPVDSESGSTRTRSAAKFEDLVLKKRLDKSTPKLMEACANGKSFDEIVLVVRKDSGDAHLDYLEITMNNVIVTSVNINGTDSDDRPLVSVGFDFEVVEMVYTEFDETGKSAGEVSMTWNIQEATP